MNWPQPPRRFLRAVLGVLASGSLTSARLAQDPVSLQPTNPPSQAAPTAERFDLPAGITVHSRSGQFVIYSQHPTTPTLAPYAFAGGEGLVAISPDLLAVACERIKLALLRELDLPDRWRGKIHVRIRSNLGGGFTPTVAAVRYADGWQYGVELAEQSRRDVLIRTILRALLTEMAHRSPSGRIPELPVWLLEALTARLMTAIGPDMIPVPTAVVGRVGDRFGRLDVAASERSLVGDLQAIRGRLVSQGPLTFNELSLPRPDQLQGESLQNYRANAQLFLIELQKLPGGRQCLVNLIGALTQTWNWQTAFVQAFANHFSRLLDVEKWWALTALHFAVGDQPHSWSRAFSLDRLDELLHVEVQRREARGAPLHAMSLSLQQLIRDTEYASHREWLKERIGLLQALQMNADTQVVPVVQGYARVLRNYLAERDRFRPSSANLPASLSKLTRVIDDTLRRLDEWDGRRATQRALDARTRLATQPEATSPR